MKRITSLFLVIALCLPLAACSPRHSSQPSEDQPTVSSPSGDKPITSAPTGDMPTTSTPSGDEPTTSAPTDDEPTTSTPSGDELTTSAPTDDEPTTSTPSGDELTTSAPTDDEPSAPSDDKPTASAPTDDKPTASAPTDDKPTTSAPSGDKPTDPDSSGGDTVNTDVPDEFFREEEDDYVSDTIVQSGKDESQKDEDVNARFVPSGANAATTLSNGLYKTAASTYTRQRLVSMSFVKSSSSDLDDSITSENLPSSKDEDADTDVSDPTPDEEGASSSEGEDDDTDISEPIPDGENPPSLGGEDDQTDASESATETDPPQDDAGDADTSTEQSTVAPDTTIKGYEYELENCYVSGYIGNDLYIIQDFGSLGWNKKGIGHRDGSYIWSFDEGEGFFSISSMNENAIIVGNPTDESVESLWDDTSSYLFGYLVYDEESKTLTPLYEEDNLRFYTATYFIDGYAIVSVNIEGEILFGVINREGEYVIEPSYRMIHDETSNGIAIAARETAMHEIDFDAVHEVGRFITYSNTLFTNVQHVRQFSYNSSTVGLIDVKTGNEILPCQYSYIEYLGKTEYFLIDSEGKTYLFDSSDNQLNECQGVYAYFAKGWSLLKTAEDTILLRDEQGKIYSTEGLYRLTDEMSGRNLREDYFRNQASLTMTNILTSVREEMSLHYRTAPYENFYGAIEGDGLSYKIWNKAHDRFFEADSVAAGYGKLLFAKDNYVYRLDYDTFEATRLEIGFGGFSELKGFSADGHELFENVEFKTYVNMMGEGIYNVRIEQRFADGSSWFDVVVNEYGEVILDIAVNSTYAFDTNYLGAYDKALYEIAGNTEMKDNYFIIRNDGRICVLQFVRSSVSDKEDAKDENAVIDYPERTISNDGSSIYISPFIFNFADPTSIEVSFEGEILDAQRYVYNPTAQALKFHPYYLEELFGEAVKNGAPKFSFSVRAGDENATVSFIVKTYNYHQ